MMLLPISITVLEVLAQNLICARVDYLDYLGGSFRLERTWSRDVQVRH